MKGSARNCGRCGLKREGSFHPTKSPFCTVDKSNFKEGHTPKGRWAETAGGGGNKSKKEGVRGIRELTKEHEREA